LCLGLIYHFRYPQLILDYLSSMQPAVLYISTQTDPSEKLILVNRRQPGVLRKGHLKSDVILTGWHPTRRLLERMLLWAGFDEVTSLTKKEYNFPNKQFGTTNSSYYRAVCVAPKNPEA